MYLEEGCVDEFKLFEEWLYLEKFSYSEDSDDSSLLLVKVFSQKKSGSSIFRMLRSMLSVIELWSNKSLRKFQIQLTKHM